jgi:1-acyl-sn-glycerol-3-phosphate acyltransferase
MSALRFVIFVSGMLRFIAAATALHLFFRDPKMRRERILKLVSRSGMRLLRTINVQVKIQGVLPARAGSEGRLIVSNHISYLDVAVLASFFNARFVTSTEVQRMPGLGFICTLAECQFVSRHSLARLRTDLANLRETLSSGTDVLVFPEATSSRGTEILPFHLGSYCY